MSEENRSPENVQPLARPINEQQLARTVGEEPEEEAGHAEVVQPEASQEPEVEQQEEKGPVGKVADKASEKGLVNESTVDRAQEKGLIDKAEETIDKIKDKLTGR